MTQWIQSSNVKQDGTPVTRAIKIPEMSEEIWFTTNAYAEVSQTVGDLLANQIESISKVSEPSTPGEYYGNAGTNTTVKLVLADKSFNDLSVTGTADIATTSTEQIYAVSAADGGAAVQELEESISTGVIVVSKGVCVVDSAIKVGSDTTIVGKGSATTFKIADDSTISGGVFTLRSGASNVSLRNFEIDLNRDNAPDPGSHSDSLGIKTGRTGVETNVSIENVRISNGYYRGIATYDVENWTIDNVTATDMNRGAIEIDHGSTGVTVSDSYCDVPGAAFGIRLDATEQAANANTIIDTTVSGADTGIEVAGRAHHNTTVDNCTVTDAGTGIYFSTSGTVKNCSVYRPTTIGIEVGDHVDVLNAEVFAPIGVDDAISTQGAGCSIKSPSIYGGDAIVTVNEADSSVSDATVHATHGIPVRTFGNGALISGTVHAGGSAGTTLASSASAGDTEIEVSDRTFVVGERIDVDGETRFVAEWVEDATNGSANIIELESSLSSNHSSGAAVASAVSRDVIAVSADNCLVTEDQNVAGVFDNGTGNTISYTG